MAGCECSREDLCVVQGDLLEVYYKLTGVDLECVKAVYFSCDKANIRCELPYSKLMGAYCLRLPSTCTKLLTPVICSYDITVEFVDGNMLTLLQQYPFAVLKKRNTLSEEDMNEHSEQDESSRDGV